jgi:hypothetical protein
VPETSIRKNFLYVCSMATFGAISLVPAGMAGASVPATVNPVVVSATLHTEAGGVSAGAHARCYNHGVAISGLATNSTNHSLTMKMDTPYGDDGPMTLKPNANASFVVMTSQTSIKHKKVDFVGHWVGRKKQIVWYTTYVSGGCKTSSEITARLV